MSRTSTPGTGEVVHTLPDLTIGGGQILLEATLDGMASVAPQYRHTVLALADGPLAERLTAVGAQVRIAPLQRIPAVIRDLRRRGVAVVHSNNTAIDRVVAQALASAAGAPLVNTLHGIAPTRSRFDLRRAVNRAVIGQVDHHIAVGSAVARSYETALGLDPGDVTVIETCLPTDRFDEPDPSVVASVRDELRGGPGGDVPILVSVGRLVEGKNPELLVEAIAQLRRTGRPVRLVFVGDGPLAGPTAAIADRLGVRDDVVLLGSRDDVRAILAGCDVFVTASETEGFPLTVLEAMVARLPVVGFAIPGLEGLAIDGVTARLAPLFDVDGLAAAIEAVLVDPAGTAAIVESAGARADEHRPERRAEEVAAVYDTILSRRGLVRAERG